MHIDTSKRVQRELLRKAQPTPGITKLEMLFVSEGITTTRMEKPFGQPHVGLLVLRETRTVEMQWHLRLAF